jgi:dolichol-phosphate mannosyltransferase
VKAALYVVLPALNEANNMPAVFDGLRALARRVGDRFDLAVLLVDDGSVDDTAEAAVSIADGLPLTVLRHESSRGPGSAFGTAFAHLASTIEPEDRVLTMEADNTSRLELADEMLRRLEEGYDVVLASPYMYGGGIVQTSPFRVVLSHVANGFAKEFLAIRGLFTVSSFYRVYRGGAFQRLQVRYGPEVVARAGFECMVELVMKLSYLRMRISEVPMVLDTQRRQGKSKMRIWRTGLGYLSLLAAKRRWREIAGGSGS